MTPTGNPGVEFTIITHPLEPQLTSARRNPTTEVDTVILHATAGSTASGAITTLRRKKLAYHYIIEGKRETDGKVWKCAPARNRVSHAGISRGPQGEGCNEYTIGISFVNDNLGKTPYTENQYQAAKGLILDLKQQFPTLKYLTTHAKVSPGRKTDPKGFDIQQPGAKESMLDRLARETGLEVWG